MRLDDEAVAAAYAAGRALALEDAVAETLVLAGSLATGDDGVA